MWRRLADLQYAMPWQQSTVVQGAVFIREGAGDMTHKHNSGPNYHYANILLVYYDWSEPKADSGWWSGCVHLPYQGDQGSSCVLNLPGMDRTLPSHEHTSSVASCICIQPTSGCGRWVRWKLDWHSYSRNHWHITPNSQWLSTTPLPISCSCISSAIVNKELYLLGGSLSRRVLNVSLPALTQTGKTSTQWCMISDAPLEYSAAIAFRGSLLAVGGSHNKQDSSAIHIYHQEKDMWTKLGDLPTLQEDCTCCLLLSGEIVVAGGRDCKGWTSRMDAAVVMD